jgi:hypothetical protein
VVGDIDPRLGEYLLDVLGIGGIAAYLQPSSDLHPVTRATVLPFRPTDRLFVDRNHLDTAQEYFSQIVDAERADERSTQPDQTELVEQADQPSHPDQGEQPDRSDIDLKFASIVAGLNLPSFPSWATDLKPPPSGSEPGATNPRHPHRRRGDRSAAPDHSYPDDPDEPSLLDGLDTFGTGLEDEEDDNDEGYVPPAPPPLPRLSSATTAAILSITLGLALLFWPALVPLDIDLTLLLGFGGILGGFLTLVFRLKPSNDDENDDPYNPPPSDFSD